MSTTDTESSLTAPEDRKTTRENPWRPSREPPLSEDSFEEAASELNVSSYIGLKFPRVDRVYADPAIMNQVYGLISFVPAKGSKPNKNGVYGYAKLRGNYGTDIETNQRAEFLIRNVDSYHQIYHCYVGRPFPLTSSSKYSAEVDEIDIKKDMSQSVSSNVKEKRMKERKEVEEIKQREAELLKESKKAEAGEAVYDDFDEYITMKVKKAQLTWTYLQHKEKMEEIKGIIVKTRKELEDMDKREPSFKEQYFDRYMTARKQAGLTENQFKQTEDNFMKFMVEDADIPEIDELYETYIETGELPHKDEPDEPVAESPVEGDKESKEETVEGPRGVEVENVTPSTSDITLG